MVILRDFRKITNAWRLGWKYNDPCRVFVYVYVLFFCEIDLIVETCFFDEIIDV